jgi:galactonate dehydratase
MKVIRVETLRLDEFPTLVWLLVHTDEGLVGLGETCVSADAVEAYIHDVAAPYLLGSDPSQIERHGRVLRPYVGSAGSGVELRAASAVDIALWDLNGQHLGRPLHDLLGGRSRDEIRTYNTCAGPRYMRAERGQTLENWGLPDRAQETHEDLDAFLHRADELARSLLEDGITGMKIWPFDPYAEASLGHDISSADLDQALEPFRKIRAAVGSAIDVMAELHALWDVPAACRIAAALDEFDLSWIEDPVRVSNPGALAEVQRATRTPIAAGETLAGLPAFRDLVSSGGAQVVIFDVGWVGGITQARKVAAIAEAFERPVAPHDCTGPVVYTASTHLSLHLPNAILQESVRAFWRNWYADLVTALPVIKDGMVTVAPLPGLGTSLRPEIFERDDARVRTSVL